MMSDILDLDLLLFVYNLRNPETLAAVRSSNQTEGVGFLFPRKNVSCWESDRLHARKGGSPRFISRDDQQKVWGNKSVDHEAGDEVKGRAPNRLCDDNVR